MPIKPAYSTKLGDIHWHGSVQLTNLPLYAVHTGRGHAYLGFLSETDGGLSSIC
jgi:hypothetical protein